MFREFDDQQSKWRQPVHPSDPFESTTQKPHIQTHIHIQILCLEIDQSLSGNQLEANQYPPKVTQVILHSVEVWERFPRLVDQVVYKTSALQWRRRRSRRSRRRRDLIQLLVLGGETDAHYARKWFLHYASEIKKLLWKNAKSGCPLQIWQQCWPPSAYYHLLITEDQNRLCASAAEKQEDCLPLVSLQS